MKHGIYYTLAIFAVALAVTNLLLYFRYHNLNIGTIKNTFHQILPFNDNEKNISNNKNTAPNIVKKLPLEYRNKAHQILEEEKTKTITEIIKDLYIAQTHIIQKIWEDIKYLYIKLKNFLTINMLHKNMNIKEVIKNEKK